MRKPVKVIRIPKGCTAVRDGNEIIIYKKLVLPIEGERCRDCTFWGIGHACDNPQKTEICLKRPKIGRINKFDDEQLYYHVSGAHIICNNYKRKE